MGHLGWLYRLNLHPRHQHCTDEAQKAETVLSAVIYIYTPKCCLAATSAELGGIEAYFMETRLRCAGCVVRMGEERLSLALLYGDLSDGTSPLGAPKKHFKDQLKNSLAKCGKSDFETLARDKTKWRTAVKADVVKLEDCRIEELKECRRCCKARISAPGCYPSDTCPKVCGSAIGLFPEFMITKGTDSIASNVDLSLCDSQTKPVSYIGCFANKRYRLIKQKQNRRYRKLYAINCNMIFSVK